VVLTLERTRGGGGWGVPTLIRLFQSFEKAIYSKGLKISVATSFAK